MKKLFVLILLVISALSVGAADEIPELSVKEIKIGTLFPVILKNFGKPASNRKGNYFPCDGGRISVVSYPGLIFEMTEDRQNNLFVASVVVTSPKLAVSGISIGTSLSKFTSKFGKPVIEKEAGYNVLSYLHRDGYAYFYFRRSKLAKIRWELNFC